MAFTWANVNWDMKILLKCTGAKRSPHEETYDENLLSETDDPQPGYFNRRGHAACTRRHDPPQQDPFIGTYADWPRVGFAIHLPIHPSVAQFDNLLAIHIRGDDPDGNG